MSESHLLAAGNPGSRLVGFGGIIGAATLGAAIASTPAALRIGGDARPCGSLGMWAILATISLAPMGVGVVLLRRARLGFAGLGNRRSLAPLLTVVLWLGTTFALLVAMGALLRMRTHHRALGGVVYALVALVACAGLGTFSIRLTGLLRRLPRSILWALAIAVGAAVGLCVAYARAGGGLALPRAESAVLVDGAAFAVSAMVASGSPLVPQRSLALVGPPVAVLVLVLGISSYRTCPRVKETLREEAPLFAKVAELVASH